MTSEQKPKLLGKAEELKPMDKEIEVRNIFDELQKNAQIETGFGEKHEARRYRQIAPYVDRMGGWANYSYWSAVHGEAHFDALAKAVKALRHYAIANGGNHPSGNVARNCLKELGVEG